MKITTTVKGACEMTGLGKTKLYELIANGTVKTATVGRRRLIAVDSIKALVEAA